MGAIEDKYLEVGGEKVLGKPTSDTFNSQGGLGRHFERGSIFSHAETGVHVVIGMIRAKYAKLGWAEGELGFPTTDELDTAQTGGRKSHFQRGVIVFKWNTQEAFEVRGAIGGKYSKLGGTKSFLGFPITDETGTPDGKGRFNHFEGGSIYWKESIGAHEVHGLIRKLWADNGWETNPALGYPISDEIPDETGKKGAYSDFENGVLFWRSGEKAAVELAKLDLGQSKTSDEMRDLIFDAIRKEVDKIPVPDKAEDIKIVSGPFWLINPFGGQLGPTTDYRVGKTRVVNRRYATRTNLEVVVDWSPDISIELDLFIEIFLNRKAGAVMFRIDRANWHIEIPWPTNTQTTTQEVSLQLEKAVEALKPGVVGTTDGANVLSVKTMLDGALNVYIEPFL